MTLPQRHIIQRQVFELNLPQQEGAYQFQQEWGRVFWSQAAPALERLFDRLAPTGTTIRLDRLELDLGNLSSEDWENELPRRLAAGIERELLKKGLLNGQAPLGPAPKVGAFFEKLGYFLETGRLPWWASPGDKMELEAALEEALADGPSAGAEGLHRKLNGNPVAVERFLSQFGEAVLAKFAKRSMPGFVSLNELRQMVRQRLEAHFERQFSRAFWQAVFEKIPPNAELKQATKRLEMALADMLDEGCREAVMAIFPQETKEAPPSANATVQHGGDQETAERSGYPFSVNKGEKEEAIPYFVAKKMEQPSTGELEAGEAIYVENAGLALLTPFMPRFFENLGLLDGQQFVSRESCHRAIHLLEFIASGVEQPYEFALPLNKLLCGLPLGQPTERLITLTTEEKAEAETLLQSVIEHWPALKNTSQEGLREAFLRRTGKLTRKPSGDWLLQVERKTLDVLLDRIPWGFSVVKMPWMKEMLWVEWNH